jgi:hypothetical protein
LGSKNGSVAKFDFGGKIRKLGISNSTTYRLLNSRKCNFATEPAQVVKQYRRRRLVGVRHRVVFDTLAGVKQVLAAQGWQINTAFIERVNLTIRQHVAAVGRRVMTLCKGTFHRI